MGLGLQAAGLICGQDCGYDCCHQGSAGALILSSPLLVWLWTDTGELPQGRERHGFQGWGGAVFGILSCNLLTLPFFFIPKYTFNILTDVCGNVNSVAVMYC